MPATHRQATKHDGCALADPVARRTFLKLMGASLALAGATACTRQPAEKIVPYVRQPEDIVPGRPESLTALHISLGQAF